jgi:hypothetical protein
MGLPEEKMHNVRNIVFAAAMTGFILACGLGGTPAAPGDDVATIVASTLQALTPVVPASTTTSPTPAPKGIPVTYKNVSFVIPTGLAGDAAPQTIPVATDQNGGPWDAAPEHIEFRLDAYNVPSGGFSICQLDVYPAQEYADANAGANIGLQRLQGLLSDPSAPLTNKTLPQVPYFNAASMLAAQVRRIHFQNGDGVRMVTQYGQAFGPVANNGTFYHFQGLTSDGKYYIVAVLPVQAPFLQNGNDASAPVPAGGVPFPGYSPSDPKVYDDYFKAVADKFNSRDSGVFQPSLTALDALVQSISVKP